MENIVIEKINVEYDYCLLFNCGADILKPEGRTYDSRPNHMQIIVPSASTLKLSLSILHQVPEGHVGVYWRGGALLNKITDPGTMYSTT